MPRVVVVTAVKNGAAYIDDALRSIQAQTYTDWAHVVVDDASTDDTTAIVEAVAAEDSRVSLVRLPESVGSYAAANVAMLTADCDYLARLDADDLSEPKRLELQVAALDANRQAKGCVSSWRRIDAAGVEERIQLMPTHRNGVIKWMLWVRGGPLHSSLLVDAEWFKARGGYGPERIAEDYRIWCALARESGFRVLDEPLVRYRIHGSQITKEPGSFDAPARIRVRREHFELCRPRHHWTDEDARDLRYIGRYDPAPFPMERALELLRRWEDEWRHDATLDAGDRAELSARFARMYVAHLWRCWKRSEPGVIPHVMRHSPRVARSLTKLRAPALRVKWAND